MLFGPRCVVRQNERLLAAVNEDARTFSGGYGQVSVPIAIDVTQRHDPVRELTANPRLRKKMASWCADGRTGLDPEPDSGRRVQRPGGNRSSVINLCDERCRCRRAADDGEFRPRITDKIPQRDDLDCAVNRGAVADQGYWSRHGRRKTAPEQRRPGARTAADCPVDEHEVLTLVGVEVADAEHLPLRGAMAHVGNQDR